MAEERLQKLMARAGLGSRRDCEKTIKQGRVRVNGDVATIGDKADPDSDSITVDGRPLDMPETLTYIMYHKPAGVISDADNNDEYPAARDAIPLEGHLYPVGRLDVRSEGLMLFTNDGDLAHKLAHPSYDHPKTYVVWVEGSPTERALEAWRRGIMLGKRRTRAASIEREGSDRDGTRLRVVLREGRKRQIRRVAAQLGYPVTRLRRVGIGPLEMGDLPVGAWRALTDEEVAELKRIRRSKRRGK
ncbi:MAG: rRNA pseudouridine synthase [Chloroflexi bacterium]|nr:rRNA pseudouridine synthase [Chloroflexota bacterium]